jgi:hypothetical protein
MVKKNKDPFNPTNNEFRASLNPTEQRKALATMRFIGCDSRAVYVKMALASFQKNNCPPNEQ